MPEALRSVPGVRGNVSDCVHPPRAPCPNLLLQSPLLDPVSTVMLRWAPVDWSILLTSFKLEMRPEEELERPNRFSMVVRLLLK